jgi:hypothetical protein
MATITPRLCCAKKGSKVRQKGTLGTFSSAIAACKCFCASVCFLLLIVKSSKNQASYKYFHKPAMHLHYTIKKNKSQ